MICARRAPIAARTANSRLRAAERASIKFAILAHAINKNQAHRSKNHEEKFAGIPNQHFL